VWCEKKTDGPRKMAASTSPDEPEVDESGNRMWRNAKNLLQRTDGPAIERANGGTEWRVDGLKHRLDGPAVEYADGERRWFQRGKLHRDDGPAVECADGGKEWYHHGRCHRLDGPAVERTDGERRWFVGDMQVCQDVHQVAARTSAAPTLQPSRRPPAARMWTESERRRSGDLPELR
jgi:hypothetical protein